MSWATSSVMTRATAVALALLLASVAAWAQPRASASNDRGPGSDPTSTQAAAEGSGKQLYQPTGNPDRDFAVIMRAHHQEGVDMAKLEIARGKSTKLKLIARRIVKDQQREIIELDKWTSRHDLRLSSDEASTRRR